MSIVKVLRKLIMENDGDDTGIHKVSDGIEELFATVSGASDIDDSSLELLEPLEPSPGTNS